MSTYIWLEATTLLHPPLSGPSVLAQPSCIMELLWSTEQHLW